MWVDGKVVNKRIGAKFSSTLFVDAAIEFLQNHDGKKPFYLYVPFTAPHDPPASAKRIYRPLLGQRGTVAEELPAPTPVQQWLAGPPR
ncbi:MAG: hypothetical protein KatS3mg105_3782 [Gemmatales bacterium]|nr:MAG: hypothetical protein KatS3mg105_3782 [Gemmatales bacterium]